MVMEGAYLYLFFQKVKHMKISVKNHTLLKSTVNERKWWLEIKISYPYVTINYRVEFCIQDSVSGHFLEA